MSFETETKKLHIAFFPWLAFGHIIPFLEFAKQIAQRGHRVSFISTPRNIQRLPKIPPALASSIDLIQLPLSHVENLPENAEATMDVTVDLIPYLKIAQDGLEAGVSNFLETHTPDWIINDFTPYWLPALAIKLGISRAQFSILNASALCFFGPTSPDQIERYGLRKLPEQFTVPPPWIPFPTNQFMKPFETRRMFHSVKPKYASDSNTGVNDWTRMTSTIQGCQVYFVRTCREIEGEWLDLLQDLHRKPVVLPAGLLPPQLQQQRSEDQEDPRIIEWLDKQEKGTVVYVAFGSEVNPSQEDFTELALGLELSGLPFFWAMRKSPQIEDGDSVRLPDGFVDRTIGRGIVWTTWAPQLKILSHESIGGFLTHCGWSSVIEGLHYGRPLIMFPVLYDQGLNARFWDKKVGIEIPRDEENGSFNRNMVAESLRLVVMDEEGKAHRDGAKEYSGLFGDKDLHDRYMDKCVEYLETNASNRAAHLRDTF
ncbi:hypothetical protein ACLB2K_001582 [Fragaria x ananassa]